MKNFTFILFMLGSIMASGQSVIINEVYGAGGNSGALFTHDYVELYNASATPVDLAGWSIQYASAAATGTWQVTPLTGTIEPGRHFLIQLGGGSGNGIPLPTPDVLGTTALAASAGKVALANSLAGLSGPCPVGAQIMDMVGYGSSATCFEGAGPTPAPSATLAVMRLTDGADTNSNVADFRTSAPSPQHSLPRSQVISFGPLANRIYGDGPFNLIAGASSGLPVTFESSDNTIAEISGTTLTIRRAGNATITARQIGNAFFMPAAVVQSLHIEKALLTVTVDAATRLQGEPNPAFTIRYSGFVGSESESSITALPTASCDALPESAPGDYEITLTGGSAGNYHFVFVHGRLTVAPSQAVPSVHSLSPADGASGVVLDARFKAVYVHGATTYFMQLSTDPDFTTFAERQGRRIQYFDGLEYSTRYYLRMRTDLSPSFGRVTSFTTASHSQATVLIAPPVNARHVGLSPHLRFAEVKGASQFFFEVSITPDFSDILIAQNGMRSQVIHGLLPGTTYYVRAHTELSADWGPTRSFRTAPLNELCFVKTPGARAERVSWLPEITLNEVGAASYTVQLSEAYDFAEAIDYPGVSSRFVTMSPLKFRTQYFSRVRDASVPDGWGPVRSFTTAHPSDYAILKYPEDGSEVEGALVRLGVAPVPGASEYFIVLSRVPDFSTADNTLSTISRSARISLPPGTTWYARVYTDLSAEAGRVTSFATASSDQVLAMPQGDSPTTVAQPTGEATAFPNPFSDRLTIQIPHDGTQVIVVNLHGEVIYDYTHQSGTLELGQAWLPGVYVVKLNGARTHSTRVVKRP